MVAMPFAGLILLCFLLSHLIARALARSARRFLVLRVILLPGIVLHELSHVLACLVTFTPIKQVSFWTAQGGHVIHNKPRWPLLTQPIISLAPLPIGIIAVYLLSGLVLSAGMPLAPLAAILLVSVSATLAPSSTDLSLAVAGALLAALVYGLAGTFYPTSTQTAVPMLTRLTPPLMSVTVVLFIIWMALVGYNTLRKSI
jgi:hypothetical protein